MALRECPNHGWIETADYSPDDSGELRCDECGEPVRGHRLPGSYHGP